MTLITNTTTTALAAHCSQPAWPLLCTAPMARACCRAGAMSPASPSGVSPSLLGSCAAQVVVVGGGDTQQGR
jgi:hypothetical protein